ncbi:hypothetical protein LUZ60_012698 [Juncus effusus]|nr:hypothetical protein LUZ60_012698 [Juncus effusus]
MGEQTMLGLLRLKVEKGVNLAIRDIIRSSSDPYIIFRVGKQEVKTHVQRGTTNPEWDERLTLSVEDPNDPLKLEVWDKDTLSRDDRMGHAEIDLRPLIDAGEQDMSNEQDGFVINTVVASRENDFADESKIYWSGGKVTQDIVILSEVSNVDFCPQSGFKT